MLAKNNDNYKVMFRVSRVGREDRLNQDGEIEQAGARLAVAVNIFVCGRLSFAIDIFFRFHLCYCGGRVCQMFQIDTIKMKDEEDTCFGQIFTSCTRKSCPGHFKRNQRKRTFKKYIF